MNKAAIALINNLFTRYHHPRYLTADPLEYVKRFSSSSDREIVGMIASGLAYGRVEQIRKSIELVLEVIGPSPSSWVEAVPYSRKQTLLGHIKHRFTTGHSIALLFETLRLVYSSYGSLQKLFIHGMTPHDQTIRPGLEHFVDALRDCATTIDPGNQKGVAYLLPNPKAGSACKRLNMFLRWMVRPDDGIDCGVWKKISPTLLIVPVDTHIAQAARTLGITRRNQADWAMAQEITAALKKIDPHDPVKYDFSLCKWGIVDFRTRKKRGTKAKNTH